MLKKGKPTQDKKVQYLRKDSSFNIRDLVMRTPASSTPDRSPEIYSEEKQTKSTKQDIIPKPSHTDLLRTGNEKLENIIKELSSFDVSTIQRRSDPRMKALTGRMNDILAEIFGRNTEEYDDHVIWSLDTLPITIGGSWYPLPEVREGYQKGIQSAISKISSLLDAQKKKLEAFAAEKPTSPVLQEPNVNQVIATKDKVSLVNLRGKIKSRETVLFNYTQPANGNGPASRSLISEPGLLEGATCGAHQENNYNPLGTEEKGIFEVNGDQRSIEETPRDHKNAVLLENLEEMLKKLEEEMPVFEVPEQEIIVSQNQEPQTAPIQKRQDNKVPGDPGHEEVPLVGLMAKLNEIVSSEPEYAEAYTKMVPGNEEKSLSLYDDEDCTRAVIDGETSCAFFVEMTGLESSGLEIEEEVLVIDGDNVLSLESDFIEVLEGDNRAQEAVESALKNGHIDNITDGKKGISLEALEQKLREFEEKEGAGKDLPTDSEKTESEEVLLIEGTDKLPEDMMNEFAQETGSAEVWEAKIGNEEVLVIDGDEELSQEPVSLESVCDNPQEEEVLVIDGDSAITVNVGEEMSGDSLDDQEKEITTLETLEIKLKAFTPVDSDKQAFSMHDERQWDEKILQGAAQDSIVNEEILVIDCDTGLPEDVSDELPHEQDISDNQEEKSYGLESSLGASNGLDVLPDQFDIGRTLIIDLFSQATPFDVALHDRDEHTTKAVLLEDLGERLRELDRLQSDQEYLNPTNLYSVEEIEVHTEKSEADELTAEKHFVDFADSNHKQPKDQPMVAFFGYDFLAITRVHESIIEPTVYVTLEHVITAPRFMEIAHTHGGSDSAYDITEEVPDKDLTEEKAYEELPDQILLKNIACSSDHDYETLLASPADVLDFEPTLIETVDEDSLELDKDELAQFDLNALLDVENADQGKLNAFGEVIPEEAVFIVRDEELANEATRELGEENEITLMELPEQIKDALECNLTDEELITISEREELPHEIAENLFDEAILLEVNGPQEPMSLQPDIDQANTEGVSKSFDCEAAFFQSVEDLATEPVLVENNNEFPESYGMDELASVERREFGFLEIEDVFAAVDHDTMTHNAALELTEECGPLTMLENNFSEDEPLTLEAFEKCLKDFEGDTSAESRVDESSRDSILLEALEEMLSNLETSTSEQSCVQPDVNTTQSTSQPKDEKVLVIDSQKEPPKKAVLIKAKEERSNPFAVTEIGKERPHSKVLRADDLQTQIGELRYRIDDLQAFDIDTIEQRFDPRVRALGDTVNNTLADIFGRNTSAYWQHALPSLDSLPVVVGGPKFSQEELRDAYQRRINDAISKVSITIDILEVKLGSLDGKGVLREQPDVNTTQSTSQPKDEKVLVIDSQKEPPKKAVLIKAKEERSNPFAVTEIGKERPHSKVLRADDLQTQIGELRYRIDDLQAFDIDTIEQRFDPRVRALGDTVNNTLADIFGRNTSAYWQHALPSLDSLPVVVGGPKFSQEELRDAYQRRINDAISKVSITIDILEVKLGSLEGKGTGGQVIFFAPKAPKYSDIQSLR
jgi:hypothetical protein